MTSKIKFGVWLPLYGGWLIGGQIEEPEMSFRYVQKTALEAEQIGYDSLWVADHLLNPRKGEQYGALEAWTTISAIAAVTRHIKLGHAVLCQAFRSPGVLAKMSATLDEVSNGRFIFSIGAGWFEREFHAYGIPWSDHNELIAQTAEQISLIKELWTQDRVNFNGKYYHLCDGILEPKPVQKPHPPIWYGGNSETSRQVIVNNPDINCWFMSAAPADEIKGRIADMKNRIGNRQLEYATYAFAMVTDTEAEAKERLMKLCPEKQASVDWALKTGLVGPPEKIMAQIQELEKAGINHITLMMSATLNDMGIFNSRVIKQIR